MSNFRSSLAAAALTSTLTAAPGMAQTATTLPPNVQADIATVKQDLANVKAAEAQLRADEETNTSSVPADRTALAIARLQLRMDMAKLHTDALPIMAADETALFNALTQLHADQVSNNSTAITTDQAGVHAAEQQLEVDRAAIEVMAGPPPRGGWRRM